MRRGRPHHPRRRKESSPESSRRQLKIVDVARWPRERKKRKKTKTLDKIHKQQIKAIRARVHPRTLEAEVERPAGRLLEAVVGARAAATDIAADIFAVGFWKRCASEREPTCNSNGQIVTQSDVGYFIFPAKSERFFYPGGWKKAKSKKKSKKSQKRRDTSRACPKNECVAPTTVEILKVPQEKEKEIFFTN